MTLVTHPGFLNAIIREPADDTPRLIYADWLDDHGDFDRAEFIRLQIELASLPVFPGVRMLGDLQIESGTDIHVSGLIRAEDLPRIPPAQIGQLGGDLGVRLRFGPRWEAPLALLDSSSVRRASRHRFISARFKLLPVVEGERVVFYREYDDLDERRRARLEARERELLDVYYHSWVTEFDDVFGSECWHGSDDPTAILAHFRRGFVADLRCTAADFLTHADALLSGQPIERVALTTWPMPEDISAREWKHDLHEGTAQQFFAAEWKGIEFTFPQNQVQAHTQPAGISLPATGIAGQTFLFVNQSAESVRVGGIEIEPGSAADCVWDDGWRVIGTMSHAEHASAPVGPIAALMDAVADEIEQAFPDVPVEQV